MRLTDALSELFLPAACASCREAPAAGRGLCGACEADLPTGPPRLALPRFGDAPPVLAAGAYGGSLAEALNEYKERRRRELAVVLAGLLWGPYAAVADEVPGAVLVPVPPTRRARRERGFDHVGAVSRLIGPTRRCLKALPRPDSVDLAPSRRRAAARQSLRVLPRRAAALAASGRPAVLVDDIVTTGATLAAAAAVLRKAGVRVPAAIVVASR